MSASVLKVHAPSRMREMRFAGLAALTRRAAAKFKVPFGMALLLEWALEPEAGG